MKEGLRNRLKKLEKECNGKYLCSGSCDYCKICARVDGEECRNHHLMGYSMDSIGANVVKTTNDFFGFDIKWIGKDQDCLNI